MDIAMEEIAPVQVPIMAVLIKREVLALLRSKMKAAASGTINIATNAGLEILCLLKYSNIYQTPSFSHKQHSLNMNTLVRTKRK